MSLAFTMDVTTMIALISCTAIIVGGLASESIFK